ncbi:hypothetical protein AB0F91_11735 [Amycolatopsis sp. NPDC023774]|uniref:hypothetical protein n=1 Tax=Amycolatopsis sp. NPDC023774 TaxID=3155015 RepID=UPI0033D880BA
MTTIGKSAVKHIHAVQKARKQTTYSPTSPQDVLPRLRQRRESRRPHDARAAGDRRPRVHAASVADIRGDHAKVLAIAYIAVRALTACGRAAAAVCA